MSKFVLIVTFVFLSVYPDSSNAQTSGELHYRWISDSTYEFTYVVYGACTGCGMTNSQVNLFAKSDSLKYYTYPFGVQVLYLVATNYNNLLPLPKGLSNCGINSYRYANYFQECYRELVYRGNFRLPGRASDWVFWTHPSCWRNDNDNMGGLEAYAECGINNLDFPDSVAKNISPLWMNRRPNIPGHLTDTLINIETGIIILI